MPQNDDIPAVELDFSRLDGLSESLGGPGIPGGRPPGLLPGQPGPFTPTGLRVPVQERQPIDMEAVKKLGLGAVALAVTGGLVALLYKDHQETVLLRNGGAPEETVRKKKRSSRTKRTGRTQAIAKRPVPVSDEHDDDDEHDDEDDDDGT